MKKLFSKINIQILAFSITAIIAPYSSFSQESKSNDSFEKKPFSEGMIFTGTIGYSSYFGDLTEDGSKNILPFNNQSQPGFGLAAHKEFFGFFELGLKGIVGKVKEVNTTKRPNNDNQYSFNSNITQIGLNTNINLVNLFRKESENRFAVLLMGGLGITSYKPESSILFPNGSEGEFPASVSSGESESSIAGTISYGLGLRYLLNDNWAVGLEASLYNLAEDDLDSWKFDGSTNDKYSFVGANVSYVIPKSKKKDIPKELEETETAAQVQPKIVEKVANDVKEEEVEEKAPKTTTTDQESNLDNSDTQVSKEKESDKIATPKAKLTLESFKDDIVYFDLNASNESSALKAQVSSIAKKLKEYPNVKIKLAGYADKSGSESYNQMLSTRRAKWLKDMLVANFNISADRISIVGMGTKGAKDEFDPNNRRVEVIEVK